jgi:hypothetical protein
MTSQKCQPRHGQKIHGLVTMDMFKTTCPKWLKGFFNACPKWVFFLPKILEKKTSNSSSEHWFYTLSFKFYFMIDNSFIDIKF